ncbi:MAG: TIM barrel protein [Actinomycetota bacterium]
MTDAAANVLDQLAAAPISWGICEVPGWGAQLPPERVLREMHDLGFRETELGAAGYLPEDPQALTDMLASYELRLCGAFIPVVIHDPVESAATRQAVDDAITLLNATGARYFITAPVMTWDWGPRRPLSDSEWGRTYAFLDEIEDACAENGLVQAVHPHIGTVIESDDDVQRVLDNTRAGFTLDTGHLLIGGYDPLHFVEHHYDRIRHVHLKDVVMDLALPVLHGERSIMEGVQAGMFCNLGAGDVPLTEVVQAVEKRGFEGLYVIEQDAAIVGDLPPENAGPKNDIAASVAYLAGLSSQAAAVEHQQPMEGNSQ